MLSLLVRHIVCHLWNAQFEERLGMEKPGLSSALWSTAGIFSVAFEQRAGVLFSSSLI